MTGNWYVFHDFQKGLKQYMTSSPLWKTENSGDSWKRGMITQACAQDLEELLVPDFVPGDEEAKSLLVAKLVFECTLLTDQGTALIYSHMTNFDAQMIYKDMAAYALKSTKASIDSSDILAYIMLVKFGDGSWVESALSLILHW